MQSRIDPQTKITHDALITDAKLQFIFIVCLLLGKQGQLQRAAVSQKTRIIEEIRSGEVKTLHPFIDRKVIILFPAALFKERNRDGAAAA